MHGIILAAILVIANPTPSVHVSHGRLVMVGHEIDIGYKPSWFYGNIGASCDNGNLRLWARKGQDRDGDVVEFSMSQNRDGVDAKYRIRMPADYSDITVSMWEPNVTLLLIRHPETKWMLAGVLQKIDAEPWSFDITTKAQVYPQFFHADQSTKSKVDRLVELLDSSHPRERIAAAGELRKVGEPAALYLFSEKDRDNLSPEQNRGIDEFLSQWPVLDARDRAECRHDPDLLKPPVPKYFQEQGDWMPYREEGINEEG